METVWYRDKVFWIAAFMVFWMFSMLYSRLGKIHDLLYDLVAHFGAEKRKMDPLADIDDADAMRIRRGKG